VYRQFQLKGDSDRQKKRTEEEVLPRSNRLRLERRGRIDDIAYILLSTQIYINYNECFRILVVIEIPNSRDEFKNPVMEFGVMIVNYFENSD
jgi:hypothetical protein